MSGERRRLQRRLSERSEYVLFSVADGRAFLCPLEDLSAGGMRVGCAGDTASVLTPKQPICIDDCPRNLRNVLRRVRGEVVWASGEFSGICFHDRLCVTNQELHTLLAEPEALPWADWPEG